MPAPSDAEKDAVRLRDILNAARAAISHAKGKRGFAAFAASRKTVAAVEREMEIAGEAATALSSGLIGRYPSPHWAGLKTMRIVLAHRYAETDSLILWNTLQGDYRDLVKFVERVLDAEEARRG